LAPYLLNVIESTSNDFHNLPAELPASLFMIDYLLPMLDTAFSFLIFPTTKKFYSRKSSQLVTGLKI